MLPSKGRYLPIEGSANPQLNADSHVGALTSDAPIQVTVLLRSNPAYDWEGRCDSILAQGPGKQERLSDQEFEQLFSAAPEDAAKVEQFAKDQGLSVISTDLLGRSVVLEGTPSALGQAFGVELGLYNYAGDTYRGHAGHVHLHSDIADVVEHVLGLDTLPLFRRPAAASKLVAAPIRTPQDVMDLYRFPTDAQGKHQCIGIVELGGGFHHSDLEAYFAQIGMRMPKISVVGENKPATKKALKEYLKSATGGGSSTDSSSAQPPSSDVLWTFETTMDVELVGAFANQAHIVVYLVGGFDAQTIVQTLIRVITGKEYRPTILSASWGEAETVLPKIVLRVADKLMKALAARGITLCCATGDEGSSGVMPMSSDLAVQYPASSPYALACGGTRLEGKDGTITSEIVWNTASSGADIPPMYRMATGGGVSAVFDQPSWQQLQGAENLSNLSGRGTPDVCSNADVATGCQILVGGVETSAGGTSSVAPLWAGLLARINEKLGFSVGYVTPLFYTKECAEALNDITQGNNNITSGGGQYNAGPSWDACTGLGSPDGIKLAEALKRVLESGKNARRIMVVDAGKHKSKQVKQLRRGQGKLATKLSALVADLQTDGSLKAGADTVVLVVERRPDQTDTL